VNDFKNFSTPQLKAILVIKILEVHAKISAPL
jgi:hypothetical protein